MSRNEHSAVEARNLRAPVAQAFTPSSTDLDDMIRRAMAACDASAARARADQFEAAVAHNKRRARAGHQNKLVRAGTRNGNPF